MLFSHDTEQALLAAAALVNTLEAADDRLPDLASLDRFLEEWGWTGSRRRGTDELKQVRDLRPRLRGLWDSDEDTLVSEVNAILREAHALPQLVRHGPWPYHIHATSPETPLPERMAVEAAMAMVDVVRLGLRDRLTICEADECDDVVVDLSRNRSRRYCSVTCSNRVNVAAFRARRR